MTYLISEIYPLISTPFLSIQELPTSLTPSTPSQVYLRLRKTTAASDAYTICQEDPMCLIATAPEQTETHKNSRRNHTLSVQKFKFTRIFIPETTQSDLFESTALPLLGKLFVCLFVIAASRR